MSQNSYAAVKRRVDRDLDREFMEFVVLFEPNIKKGIFRMRGLRHESDLRQEMTIKIWQLTLAHTPDRGPIEVYIGRSLHNFISTQFRRLRASNRHVEQMTTVSLEQAQEAARNGEGRRSSARKSDGSALLGGDDGELCELSGTFEAMHDLDALGLTENESWYAYAGIHGVPAAEATEMLGVSHATQCRTRASLARKLSNHVGYQVTAGAE